MKILLITKLYPGYEGQSINEMTYSLHNFVRIWNASNEILVVRTYVIPVRNKKMLLKANTIIDNIKIINIPIIRIPKTGIYFYKLFMKYATRKLQFKPDIIIAHLGFNLFLGRLFAIKYRVPLVCGIHGSDINDINKKINKDKYRVLLNNCQAIACRSHYIFNYIQKEYEEIKQNCFVAYSGIDKKKICSLDFYIDKINEWKSNREIRFVTVARLQKLKNIDVNIRALYKLNKGKKWTYRIIGDGEELENLKKLVKELNMDNRISFLGFKKHEEVLNELKNTDIFIMVSAPETFGLAYLEAMATGNIVIGAKGFGIDGIIENNKNGFLCNPSNDNELYKTLQNIIYEKEREEIIKIAISSYQTITKMTLEDAAENYMNRIVDLVTNKSKLKQQ